MTEDDVHPENPRPAGRYLVEAKSIWYYVNDDLTRTIATGPATDAEPDDDWILTFTAPGATPDDGEHGCVRVTPRVLHELYIETTDRSAASRMADHNAECALCGDHVDCHRMIPNSQGGTRRIAAAGGGRWPVPDRRSPSSCSDCAMSTATTRTARTTPFRPRSATIPPMSRGACWNCRSTPSGPRPCRT